jgi:hypothetical protein
MNKKAQAEELLEEFNLCWRARPKHNAVDIQLEKDSCAKWAYHLNSRLAWGTDDEIVEAYEKLEPKLKKLKEKVIIEILQNGTI